MQFGFRLEAMSAKKTICRGSLEMAVGSANKTEPLSLRPGQEVRSPLPAQAASGAAEWSSVMPRQPCWRRNAGTRRQKTTLTVSSNGRDIASIGGRRALYRCRWIALEVVP